jgi:Peptidase family M28
MRFVAAGSIVLGALAWARGAEPAALPVDPEIAQMVDSIASARIQRSIFVLVSFKTRHTLSDPQPSGDGIGGASAWVRAELERDSRGTGGRLRVDLDTFRQPARPPLIPHPVDLTNVVATLPGSSKRVFLLTAHYDSRVRDPLDTQSPAPGADDNASGVAVLLETARALAPFQFNATIVFLVTTGGEQGGVGAAHWADQARQQGLEVAGVIDLDAIGRTHGAANRRDLWLFAQGAPPLDEQGPAFKALIAAGGENDSPARALARAVRAAAGRYVPAIDVRIIYRPTGYQGHGGHLPFLQRGFPAVGLTEAGGDRDLADDTPDALDFAYMSDVAHVSAAVLAGLARAPAPPRGVEQAPAPACQGTVLRWTPADGPPPAGYRVVWRETTAPFWEHARDVDQAAVNANVAGVLPDSTLFGVEAFDAAGHLSPAAFALPAARP